MDNPSGLPQVRVLWQLDNHLGSSGTELDNSAQVITYEEYHPFGSTSFHTVNCGTEVSAKRYRYTGKERDDETGLYYYGARYYASWLGRWLSSDQSVEDGWNLYVYVRNNPILLIDPNGSSGLNFQTIHANPSMYNVNTVELRSGGVAYIEKLNLSSTELKTLHSQIRSEIGPNRMPINWQYAGREMIVHMKSGTYTVPFTSVAESEGNVGPKFPETTPQSTLPSYKVEGMTGIHKEDLPAMRKQYKTETGKPFPKKNYTPHHAGVKESLPVNKDLHDAVRHTGSASQARQAASGVKLRAVGSGALWAVFIAMEVLSAHERAKEQYTWGPYEFEDSLGKFTIGYSPIKVLGIQIGISDPFKKYFDGDASGLEMKISNEEFKEYKEEGKKKWGYMNFWGEFVPGTERKELPKASEMPYDPIKNPHGVI